MAKGFGYKYKGGLVRFTIKYGPIIAGLVVNNQWRRIVFRNTEGAAKAIKSLEKAGMYEQYMDHISKLEEIPDTYYVSLYDVHLGPYIKNYVPSSGVNVSTTVDGYLNVPDFDGAVDSYALNRLANRYNGVAVSGLRRSAPIPYTMEEFEQVTRGVPTPAYTWDETANEVRLPTRRTAQWLRGDWTSAEARAIGNEQTQRVPDNRVPIPQADAPYPTDRAIDNMRGTEQERERSRRQAQLMEQLDRMARYITPR